MSDTEVTEANRAPDPAPIRLFDFRKANKLNRDHLRNLEIVHETFARQFSTVLSSTLRAISQLHVTSIEQQTYDEFIGSTPNPTFLAILSTPPLSGSSLLQLPLDIALTAIDYLLGGSGRAVDARSLTEIELRLMNSLTDRVLAELAYAFNSVTPIKPSIVRHESNPQFAQIAAPTDMMIVVTFSIRIESVAGTASLCFPYSTLQPVLESFTGTLAQHTAGGMDLERAAAQLERALLDVPVDFAVELPPVKLSSREIAQLAPGDVIPFPVAFDEPITGTVGGLPTFLVRPARKGKRLVAQIVRTAPNTPTAIPAVRTARASAADPAVPDADNDPSRMP